MSEKPTLTKYELTELEIRILNTLEVGHNNAIPLKVLCLRVAERERQVRLAIESLRLQGYIVLFFPGAPQGYGIAETQEEVDSFIEYMRSRIISECLILRNIKVAATKKFTKSFGQIKLFMDD